MKKLPTSKFIGWNLQLLVVCVSSVLFYACQKSQEPAGTSSANTNTGGSSGSTYVDSITVSDCRYTGEVLNFSSRPPAASVVTDPVWDFGDGSKSAGRAAQHTYSNPGSYNVTFTANGRIFVVSEYDFSSSYTAKMAGKRHWKGHGAGMVNEFPNFPYGSGDIDTELVVVVVSPGVIRLPLFGTGTSFRVTNDDAVKKVLTFKSCAVSTASLQYYYEADSIVYSNYWSATVGHGYESFYMHSP